MSVHLTADDVAAVTFEPTQFRFGYEPVEVDAFLRRVEEALRTGEDLRPLLDEVGFTITRFRLGYDKGEVDEFLEGLRGGLEPAATRPSSHRAEPAPGVIPHHVRTAPPATEASVRSALSPQVQPAPADAPEPEVAARVAASGEPAPAPVSEAAAPPATDPAAGVASGSDGTVPGATTGSGIAPTPASASASGAAAPSSGVAPSGGISSAPSGGVPVGWARTTPIYSFPETEAVPESAGPSSIAPPARPAEVVPAERPAPVSSGSMVAAAGAGVVGTAGGEGATPSPDGASSPVGSEAQDQDRAGGAASGAEDRPDSAVAPAPATLRFAMGRDARGDSEVATVGGMDADEVDAVQFHAARLRKPYDMTAVDEFVDSLSTALRSGTDPQGLLGQLPFPPATGSGYRRSEVDRFVGRITSDA